MVYQVRCFKCGANQVRLIMGGRQILHARCQACQSNLLAEILSMEHDVVKQEAPKKRKRHTTLNTAKSIDRQSAANGSDN